MAIKEAVISIKMVLENLKAASDLTAVLTKMRQDIASTEKEFAKLKAQFDSNSTDSQKYAQDLKRVGDTLRGLVSDYQAASGSVGTLQEANDSMTASIIDGGRALERMAEARKRNIDASLEEKRVLDEYGESVKEITKREKARALAIVNARAAAGEEDAFDDLRNDPNFTEAEIIDAKALAQAANFQEGIFQTQTRITTQVDEQGQLIIEQISSEERLRKLREEDGKDLKEKKEQVKQTNDELEDERRIREKLIEIGKRDLASDTTNLQNVDLKNFTGEAGFQDFIDNADLATLREFRSGLSESGEEGKKLDKVIEKMEAEVESLTDAIDLETKAERRLADAQEARRRQGISSPQQDRADRQKEIEQLKSVLKARKKLSGETDEYYLRGRTGSGLEVEAARQLNRELLEQAKIRIQDKNALQGLDRRRKITEEIRKELETINHLRQQGMLADTEEGNDREARRLSDLALESQRRQLGLGESFKANLNEPAMRASRALREVGQGMQDAGRQAIMFSAALLTTTLPAIKVFADFNQEVQNVVSVLGDMSDTEVIDTVDKLSKKFLELGENTEFTANQIAAAAKSLALAGFTTNEVVQSIEAVTNLASAGNLDLEQTAGYFSNIVKAFDVDTSNAERVADVLATVATNSNTTIETLGESFKFIAPIASATGQSLEQVSTALGVLGNAGISASRAGTGLSRAFSELLEKEDDFSEILQGIGSSYDRIDPTRRTITEIVSELERLKAAGLLDTAGFFEMFDQRSARAVLTLVNQGAASMEELGEKAESSAGAADRIKEIRLDTLSGDLLKMQSALNSLQITLGGLFGDTARKVVQFVTRMTSSFREIAETAVGGGLIKFLGLLITALGVLTGGAGLLALTAGGIVRMAAAFSTTKIVISATAKTVAEFGGVLSALRGSLTSTAAATTTATSQFAGMATSSSGATAGVLGTGIAAGTLAAVLVALTAVIVILVAAVITFQNVQARFEEAFAEKNQKRVKDLTKTVDNFSSSIRKAANSLELIRKLPDLNLTQLRELTESENLFTLDFNETAIGLSSAIERGLELANRELNTNLDSQAGAFFSWDGWSAGAADLWSNISQPFADLLNGEFSSFFDRMAKNTYRLNPIFGLNGIGSTVERGFGQRSTEILTEFNEETGLNDIYIKRFDVLGEIRKTKVDISELTATEKDAMINVLAAQEQLKKLQELQVQREEMITAFSKGRVGIEQWRANLKQKEADQTAKIEQMEERRRQNERNGATEKANQIKLDLETEKQKLINIEKNLEMADRASKSTDNELKSSSAIMQNQVKQGEHLREINKLDREITQLRIKQAQLQEDGKQLNSDDVALLSEKEDLRKRQLDLLAKEKQLTEGLLETQFKITQNERRRVEIIQESNKARTEAKKTAEKTEEELEASAPIGTDAEGNPIFRTAEQEKERQRKRAREKQVGNITPEKARQKLAGQLGFDGFDPTVAMTPEQKEEFQKEVQKLQDGTSDIGTLGEFGVPVLGSMLEKRFATGVDSEAFMTAIKDQIKDIEAKKKEVLNLTRNTEEDETIEEFEFRKMAAEKEVRRLEDEQVKLKDKLDRAKKAQADGGKALDDKIKEDTARRNKQEKSMDQIDANIKAKEAEVERKKAAEEAKKEKEREDKEREKLFKKKQEALDDGKLEDKKRQLKMAKLDKNKQLEETLTEEIAKIERERAADRKFGTEEELKELKKDKNMTAEQKKILDETIKNKAKFIKEEEELFKAEKKAKKEGKKDEQIEDLNKKAAKQEEKRLSTQEKIRDAMLKQAKSLRDIVLITKFLNRQEAIRKMAQERAREKAVSSGSKLAKLLNDPNKSEKQKQSIFSKAARDLRKAKELGVSDLEMQNLAQGLKKFKDNVMNTSPASLPTATPPVVPPQNQPVNNPVNQNGAEPVQGGGVVNNVANPNVIFNLAGIKDPDEFMQMIGQNAKKITEALFTQGGQQRAKNQGKTQAPTQNKPQQPKGNFFFQGGAGPQAPTPFGN